MELRLGRKISLTQFHSQCGETRVANLNSKFDYIKYKKRKIKKYKIRFLLNSFRTILSLSEALLCDKFTKKLFQEKTKPAPA